VNEITAQTALITGASSGMGADFARQLAERGTNLVLVARREERLKQLRDSILEKHPVQIHVIPADLANPEARQILFESLQSRSIQIDILINNAGLGVYGKFVKTPWDKTNNMLHLDIVALTHLTRLFAEDMVKRGKGHVLLVASTGAFQPTPTYAAYAAAKSYVLSFGEALNYELKSTGVNCTVLCPGVTETEFFDVSGQKMTFFQKITKMKSEKVVRIGLNAMFNRKPSVVAGRMNAFMAWNTRLYPRKMVTSIAAFLMGKPE